MILWMNPVLDRSEKDVESVITLLKKGWDAMTDSEKETWLNGMKGAMNKSDYARIQNNIQLLSNVLELSLVVSEVPEIPTTSFFDEIIGNVDVIRQAYMIHSTTPETPVQPLNTFTKWNDVEQILYDVYSIILNNFNYYCGTEIYAGEETGLLL